jgi:hypothetical protein
VRPPKVKQDGSCSATTLPWKHRPSLCHLDRSAAQWRDLRSSGLFLEIFFLQIPDPLKAVSIYFQRPPAPVIWATGAL